MLEVTTERKKALAIGCTAHAIQDGLGAATYVLLPILAQAFGFGYAQVGLFKGAMSLAQAMLELSSGVLSERIGAVRTLVFGLTLAGLGYAYPVVRGAADCARVWDLRCRSIWSVQ